MPIGFVYAAMFAERFRREVRHPSAGRLTMLQAGFAVAQSSVAKIAVNCRLSANPLTTIV
jgi:hypothetical protein